MTTNNTCNICFQSCLLIRYKRQFLTSRSISPRHSPFSKSLSVRLKPTQRSPQIKTTKIISSSSVSKQSENQSRNTNNFNSPPPLPSSSNTYLNLSFFLCILSYSLPVFFALIDISQHSQLDLSNLFQLVSTKYQSHWLISFYATLFALVHSGLASLRPFITPYIGQRLYRIIFAVASLPSAGALLAYFIAHRYDGLQLWQIQSYPFTKPFVALCSIISFFFLYPATLNIPEVAAIKKPTLKIFQKGIIRITRHPQLTGQVIWCIAHAAWVGSSFFLVASTAVVAHHCFAVWNGDRRLRDEFGTDWIEYEKVTSVLPFVAIIQKQQSFEWKEFANTGYLGVAIFIALAYWSHPAMLRLVGSLGL